MKFDDGKVSQLFDERDCPSTDIMAVKFTSRRKRYTRVYRTVDGEKVTVFSKGESELNLSRCTKMIGHNGIVKELDEQARANAQKTIEDFSQKAMRTRCISYREFSKDEWEAFSAENNNWAGDDDKNRLDESSYFAFIHREVFVEQMYL